MAEVLSLDNPVFASFAFYGALVVAKMLMMAGLISVKRTVTGATPNPEDVQFVQMMKTYSSASAEVKKKLGPKVDERVERVRRVHLNDLENIPAFFCVGLLYVLIRPDPWWAAWHFRAFFVARVSHTVAYLLAIPQPSRGIAFIAGMVTTMSLVVQNIERMADILSLDNPVFASYVFYATLSIAKMIDMGIWTSFKRIRHNIYATNEDVVIARGMAPPAKREKITAGKADERIERVRRNHLNDIENIPAFVLIGFFYLLTGPNASLALWHYRVFFISRVCHTIAYQWSLPQPARALSHVVGLSATFSMLIRILVATWKFY